MKKFFALLMILGATILISSCQKELPDAIKNIEVSQGSQDKNPEVKPSQELKASEPGQFGAKGGEQTITVTATAAWAISKSADSDWLTVKPELGVAGTTQVTLTAAENTTTGSRTAMLNVKSGELTKSINVTQSAANPEISLDLSSMEFTSGSGSKSMKITSNTSWTVSSDQAWCSVSPTSGSGDGSVSVSVEENTSTSSRTATITIESATITRTLSVTQSGAMPVTPSSSQDRIFTVGGVTFKMIAIEGGTFTMGATSEQGDDASNDEKPIHTVTLSSYSIGETEVTQALWGAVMGSNPSHFSGSKRPVEYVSWDDCQDFIRKLNALTGEHFRLPTEAEWEFAARGGNKSRGYKYSGSNNIDNVAWYSGNSNNETHNVATKQANELGIYDMSGNVWEWCSDRSGNYSSENQINPTGSISSNYRMNRGGSWGYSARRCRVSYRSYDSPDVCSYGLGLRLVL